MVLGFCMSVQSNRKDAEKRGMYGFAISHSTMYVNEIIMNATADIIQGFTLLMLHPVSRLVQSGTAISVFVKERGRRLFFVESP